MTGSGTFSSRIFCAFLLVTFLLCAGMGITGYLASNNVAEELVSRQATLVMESLIEAERLALLDHDRNSTLNFESAELARVLGWQFLVGKEVPESWLNREPGLYMNSDSFVLMENRDGISYWLSGGLGEFAGIRIRILKWLSACAITGLVLAAILSLALGRYMGRPLRKLAGAVHESEHMPHCNLDNLGNIPKDILSRNDEIGHLARTLQKRDECLAGFIRREIFFTGDVSHELRTPLTVLRGGLEILDMRLSKNSPENRIVVNRLLGTVRDMDRLFNTMLMLARSPEQLKSSPCNITLIVENIVREMRQKFSETQIEKRHGNLHPIFIKTELHQDIIHAIQPELAEIIVRNLVENACRYASDGHVSIRLTKSFLEIRNHGHSGEKIDMFCRGVRGKGNTHNGAGLGLSIVARACEIAGWEIYGVNLDGENVFRITLHDNS